MQAHREWSQKCVDEADEQEIHDQQPLPYSSKPGVMWDDKVSESSPGAVKQREKTCLNHYYAPVNVRDV